MNKKAFTLVELIATVTILGIILLIAVPSYNKYVEKAEQKKCEADKEAIIDATKNFINDCIYNNVCKDGNNIASTMEVTMEVENLITYKYLSSEYAQYNTKQIEITSSKANGITDYEAEIDMCS